MMDQGREPTNKQKKVPVPELGADEESPREELHPREELRDSHRCQQRVLLEQCCRDLVRTNTLRHILAHNYTTSDKNMVIVVDGN